ncbi:MAG TPA: AraC family transcriptional regulator [Chitinophagaceae bacterium]|nr:AraC family transcriptional regulator [Chitinophagaceae bacterium]
MSFIRKGNFLFNVFRNSFDSHTGRILITKPGYEHTVTHTHSVPDECTIFEVKQEFYDELMEHFSKGKNNFFNNNDLHSLLLKTSVETEYLHHRILVNCFRRSVSKLEMDGMVMELFQLVMKTITGGPVTDRLKDTLKKNHLSTIEKAKIYLADHFTDDISLKEIADHCYVSAFHFSRIFKTFTSYSPHQYLLNLRLKHAEMLLKNTQLPVTDICFSSGFNSLEYFSAAFGQKYKSAPSRFRASKSIG